MFQTVLGQSIALSFIIVAYRNMLDPDSNYNVSKAIITSHVLMVDSTHLWWNCGWFIEFIVAFQHQTCFFPFFTLLSSARSFTMEKTITSSTWPSQAHGLMPGMEGSGLSGFRSPGRTAWGARPYCSAQPQQAGACWASFQGLFYIILVAFSPCNLFWAAKKNWEGRDNIPLH